MANTPNDQKNDPVSVENYLNWEKFDNKWRSAKELKIVIRIRERFEELKEHRRQSCPFPARKNVISIEQFEQIAYGNQIEGGYSWEDRWLDDLNLATMKRHYIQGFPNIKSSLSESIIEAAQAKFQKMNIQQLMRATEEEDEPKVMILKEIFGCYANKSRLKKVRAGTFHDVLTTGNAFSYMTRVRKIRDVEMIISNSENAKEEVEKIMDGSDEDQKARIQKRLDSGKPLTRKERIVEYDDIARIHRSSWEIYIDPDAKCLHGMAYEANDLIDRTTPGIAEFKNEFENSLDPYVIKENVKRVRSCQDASDSYDNISSLFVVPSDVSGSTKLELLRYWNKRNDKYIVIANDIVVRDGPMPFNHKQIPYAHHKFFVIEHMLYGVGLPYLLEGLQSQDEVTRNLWIHQLKINLMPAMFRRKDAFSEEDDFTTVEPGKVYDVTGNPRDVIAWQERSSMMPEYSQARKDFRDEATLTAGFNTMSSSLPQPDSPVRNNLMSQEATDTILMKGVENWAEGDRDAVEQEIALMRQIYPETYVKKYDKETGEKTFKTVRFEGQKLTPVYEKTNEEGEKVLSALNIEDSDEPTFFEVKDKYFELAGIVEVEFDTTSLPMSSESLMLSKMEKFFQTMMTFWAKPELFDAPGASESIIAYTRLLAPLNKDKILASFRGESDKKSIARAQEQNDQMLTGTLVPGKPGESLAHRMEHLSVLFDIFTQIADPETTPEHKDELIKVGDIIHQHSALDEKPKYAASGAADAMQQAIKDAMAQQNPNQMPGQIPPQNPTMDPATMQAADQAMLAMQQGQPMMGDQSVVTPVGGI